VLAETLVVIPTYNEVDNLELVVEAVLDHGFGVLVVDDGSPDGTGELADTLAASHPDSIAVVHRPARGGLGPAYVAGFAWGLADGATVLCEMDADLSHDPAALPGLVDAVRNGADLAIGSRYVSGGSVENWPWHRRALSRLGNLYAGFMLAVPIKDMTAGYRAFSATALAGLEPDSCESAGYGFQVEMAWRACLSDMAVVEIPITFRDRVHGESKMSSRIAVEAMILVTKWGFRRLAGRLPWKPNDHRSPSSGRRRPT